MTLINIQAKVRDALSRFLHPKEIVRNTVGVKNLAKVFRCLVLTVLLVQQDLELVVDLVLQTLVDTGNCLLIGQFTVHECAAARFLHHLQHERTTQCLNTPVKFIRTQNFG